MHFGAYDIDRSEFPLGNGSPGYQIKALEGGTGFPCGWADTQIGAMAMTLGADYVQATMMRDPVQIAAAQTLIEKFIASIP